MTIAAELLFTPFDAYLAVESASEVKHEWIHGLVYAMSCGTPEHGRLSAAVVRALPQTDACRVYSSDTLLYIEKAQHSTYADASIVCPSVAVTNDGAGHGEAHEGIAEPFVADAELRAELRAADGASGAAKSVEHEGIEIARHVALGGRVAGDDGQVGVGTVANHELKA